MQNDDVTFRLVIQRARNAEVLIGERSQGVLEHGLVVLFGVSSKWNEKDGETRRFVTGRDKELVAVLDKLADKVAGLRLFCDSEGKMNLSAREVGGGFYVVSQFTLFADCRKGFRPGFSAAARPPFAAEVYDHFVSTLRSKASGLTLFTGEFAADMQVKFVNDGPVTIVLDADCNGIR
jgi:D-tyrosyl-tRNA(Tyr) deacylase